MIRKIFLLFFISCSGIFCYAQTQFISFKNNKLQYQGRILFASDAAELTWPGTSVTISFKGTSLAGEFKDADTSNYYNIIIDQKLKSRIHFDTIKKKYQLTENLPFGKHTVELFKMTEWDKGKTSFFGFELDKKSELLNPPALPKRKIEFYGNSITCGYAVEDKFGDNPIGYFENNYAAYAAITARHFNAQYQCIAKSGIGIMVSWFPLIMPEMYDRLDPLDAKSKWDFSKYTPDVVVINLLQNDSWLINNPKYPEFKHRFGETKPSKDFIIQSYQNFVKTIRGKHPKAHIICMLGNMDITRKDSPWPLYVQKAISGLKDAKIYSLIVPFKESPGHPKLKEQQDLANSLIDFIDKNIKW
nr:SGNH/GDSL hydrolase family protein [Pseudopedobacter sp.]